MPNSTTARACAVFACLSGCYSGHDSTPDDGGGTEASDGLDAQSSETSAPALGDGEDRGSTGEPDHSGGADRDESTSGSSHPDPDAPVVEFRIRLGTQGAPWNTAEDTLTAHVGQTLRLINDDRVPHTLHSFGVPLPHGDAIAPGDWADALLTAPYDPADGVPELWDHEAGEPAYFWLRVLPAPRD